MRATRSVLVMLTLGSLATIAGCAGAGDPLPDDQGTITLDLTLAPTDARCAVVTVTPAMGAAVTRSFPLSPSQTAVFSLSGLPTGNVTISEQVFTVACGMTNGATATWTADPVMVTLQAGTPVDVTFNLRRVDGGGQVNVSTNFPQPPGTFQEFAGSTVTATDQLIVVINGPDDVLWFTNITNNSIDRMSTAGTRLSSFTIPTASSLTQSIAAGSDGNVWFAEQTADKIGRVTPSGMFTEFSLATGSSPFFITAGPDGALWFTEFASNKIGRITTGGTVTEFNIPTASARPETIATGPDRNIWFTEGVGKIGRLSPGSGNVAEFAIPTTAGLPLGITAGPDGNLWFVEQTAGKVGRITTGGTVTEFNPPTAGNGATLITTGPDGALWFTEANANQIARVTTAGAFSEFSIPTARSSPIGIALGPDARLWFTEASAGQIGAFRP